LAEVNLADEMEGAGHRFAMKTVCNGSAHMFVKTPEGKTSEFSKENIQ